MTDHKNKEAISGQTPLREAFANHDADIYRKGLEVRKENLEKDIYELKRAGIVDYKLLDMNRKSLNRVSEKLRRTFDPDTTFQNALIFKTIEEASEKMSEKERDAYFEHLTKLRNKRISHDTSFWENIITAIKKKFF